MREIKFRVWDSEFKRMKSTGFSVEHGNGVCTLSCDDGVLMQYTGLQDKNGVEIYEGDIVEWRGVIETVSYSSDDACFQTETSILDSVSFSVIGNIYETPELLSQQNAG